MYETAAVGRFVVKMQKQPKELTEIIKNLSENGFADISRLYPNRHVVRHLRNKVQQLIRDKQTRISDGQSKREFHHIPNEHIQDLLKELFHPAFAKVLTGYLQAEAYYYSCAVVVVPAGAPAQLVHKDHAFGSRLVLCLALSLNENNLIRTHFRPKTHLTAAVQDITFKDMTQCLSTAVLYDTCIDHAGAENESQQVDSERLFFTFLRGGLKPKLRNQLISDNAVFLDPPPTRLPWL